MTMILVMASWW